MISAISTIGRPGSEQDIISDSDSVSLVSDIHCDNDVSDSSSFEEDVLEEEEADALLETTGSIHAENGSRDGKIIKDFTPLSTLEIQPQQNEKMVDSQRSKNKILREMERIKSMAFKHQEPKKRINITGVSRSSQMNEQDNRCEMNNQSKKIALDFKHEERISCESSTTSSDGFEESVVSESDDGCEQFLSEPKTNNRSRGSVVSLQQSIHPRQVHGKKQWFSGWAKPRVNAPPKLASRPPISITVKECEESVTKSVGSKRSVSSKSTSSTRTSKRARQLLVDIETGSQHSGSSRRSNMSTRSKASRCGWFWAVMLVLIFVVFVALALTRKKFTDNPHLQPTLMPTDDGHANNSATTNWYVDWNAYQCKKACDGSAVACDEVIAENEKRFSSLEDCCLEAFANFIGENWDLEECMSIGMSSADSATERPTVQPTQLVSTAIQQPESTLLYYADWSSSTCVEVDSNMKEPWDKGYETLSDCCEANFSWETNGACNSENIAAGEGDGGSEFISSTSSAPSSESAAYTSAPSNGVIISTPAPTPPYYLYTQSPEKSGENTRTFSTSTTTSTAAATTSTTAATPSTTTSSSTSATTASTTSGSTTSTTAVEMSTTAVETSTSSSTTASTTASTTTSSASTSTSSTRSTTTTTSTEGSSTSSTTSTSSSTKVMYFADYASGTCTQNDSTQEPYQYMEGYTSQDECCQNNFSWESYNGSCEFDDAGNATTTTSTSATTSQNGTAPSKNISPSPTSPKPVTPSPQTSNSSRFHSNPSSNAPSPVIDNVTANTSPDSNLSTSQPSNNLGTPPPSVKPQTRLPTKSPTPLPTHEPSLGPSQRKTRQPTNRPTARVTHRPTLRPTNRTNLASLTGRPTTARPTARVTHRPTPRPTNRTNSTSPTARPTVSNPTGHPTARPTGIIDRLKTYFKAISPASSEALDYERSTQYRAMEWLIDNANFSTYSNERKVQRWALATLYDSLNGGEWTMNNGWTDDSEECTWYGLVCDTSGSVIALELNDNNLRGVLEVEFVLLSKIEFVVLNTNLIWGFPPSIFSMPLLRVLDLDKNKLDEIPSGITMPSGGSRLEELYLSYNKIASIPDEMFQLRNVTCLWMSNNQISTTIPSGFGMMAKLEELDLELNYFTGSIPSEIFNLQKLRTLYLHDNSLSGTLSSSFSRMTSLEVLDLDTNHISGVVPTQIGLFSKLSELYLGDNELVGQLPWTQLALLNKTLTKFDVSSNYLNSTIGTQVGSLSKLVTLRLDNNYRTDADGYLISNGFQGTIPASIGNLNQLAELRLDNNFIAGSLPPSLGKLRSLVTLRAEGNNLKSSIPSELGNLTSLEYLHLWSNYLSSTISAQLGKLSKLKELFLDDNELTGKIPPTLGLLSNATYISLATNSLTGTIPPSFGMLSSLERLDLQSNHLTGSVPYQLASTPLTMMKLEGNSLYGDVPAGICESLQYLSANCATNTTSSTASKANYIRGLQTSSNRNSWSCYCCTTCY